MTDTVTPKLGLTLPDVGDPAGEDLWGEKLNQNFTILDDISGDWILDAPADGQIYGRRLNDWEVVDAAAPAWGDITGKPSTFPPTTPIPQSDIINLTADLANKEPVILSGSVAHFWRGDKTWAPVPSSGGGGGGPVDWADIVSKPSTFPPTLPIAQSGVTNLVTDLAAKAPLASPTFTGTPAAPTPATGSNGTQLATTAFVKVQGYAPLASPTFTGVPTAPTAAPGTNSTQLATTAFIQTLMAGLPIGDLNCGTFGTPPIVPPTPPVTGDYPTAANTGATGTLTVDARAEVYSQADGEIIQNKNFTNVTIRITHANVIVRNCRIFSSSFWAIDTQFALNALVENCTIISSGLTHGGVLMDSGIVRGCNISNFENGIYFTGSAQGVIFENNYISFDLGVGAAPHVDGIQTQECGPGPSIIRHNTIISTDTSHVFLQCTTNDVVNVKVLDNQFLKDPSQPAPSYNVFINGWGTRPNGSAAVINNVEVAFNFGDRGFYGDIDVDGNTSGISVHDNTIGFVVEPPPATVGVTLFGGASPTGGSPTIDNNEMTLGVRVDPLVAGSINAILYYRANAAAAADGKVALYNVAGTKLAEATFTGHTGVGWKRVPLATPFAVNATTGYVAAVWYKIGTDGHSWYWAEAPGKFATAAVTVTGKITAPKSDGTTSRGAVQKNNVFVYASGNITFPDQVYPVPGGSSYYVDVDFS